MNENVALSIRQFGAAWQVMCGQLAGYLDDSSNGVRYVFSCLQVPFFNAAIPTGDAITAEQLQTHGREASVWADRAGVPWLFIVTEETLAPGVDAMAELDRCGMVPLMPLTGMLVQRVVPATRLPDGLQVKTAANDEECAAIIDVNAAAYGMPLDPARDAMGRKSYWEGQFPILGRIEGEPVASTVVMMVEGYRYVALVATAPDRQRRGYADAAMRTALQTAADIHGEVPSVLHATAAGRPVYERMGYVPISSHTIFIEKKFLGEH